MLSGFDRGWSAETSQRQVSYTNLSPGRYCFQGDRLQQRRHMEPGRGEARFELRPYFFRTFWFWFIAVLGLLILAATAFRWRLRRLQRRERELQALVNERTRELSRVNEELLQAEPAAG